MQSNCGCTLNDNRVATRPSPPAGDRRCRIGRARPTPPRAHASDALPTECLDDFAVEGFQVSRKPIKCSVLTRDAQRRPRTLPSRCCPSPRATESAALESFYGIVAASARPYPGKAHCTHAVGTVRSESAPDQRRHPFQRPVLNQRLDGLNAFSVVASGACAAHSDRLDRHLDPRRSSLRSCLRRSVGLVRDGYDEALGLLLHSRVFVNPMTRLVSFPAAGAWHPWPTITGHRRKRQRSAIGPHIPQRYAPFSP